MTVRFGLARNAIQLGCEALGTHGLKSLASYKGCDGDTLPYRLSLSESM